ncbi:hypothetical protein [Nannocystis punicea]|uniref:Cache domain-containing protein n=1 Tax=Nannocystis punicea TaxID=2995304 RepID=A0ABY7GZC0_9BACT|nr:hypothetical protein [Nannocystis poenicansa]WAS92326.1 hypothetical protein O0S08_39615 [Nannocystis poenicansa]
MSPCSPRSAVAAELVLALGLVLVALQAREFFRARASLLQAVYEDVAAATRAAAADLDAAQRECMTAVQGLIADLAAGRLSFADVERRLAHEAASHPHLFGVVVVFPGSGGALLVPADIRGVKGRTHVRLDRSVDVPGTDWYAFAAAQTEPAWGGPVRGTWSGHYLALFCGPWSPPGRPSARGHVCASLSLHDLEALRQSLPAGRFGYTWLLSREGRSLSHPKVDWVRAARTPDELAEETGDPRLRELGRRAAAGEAGSLQAADPLTGRAAVMIQAPIPASGGSLIAVILRDDIVAAEPSLRRRQIDIVVAVLATLTATATLLLTGGRR